MKRVMNSQQSCFEETDVFQGFLPPFESRLNRKPKGKRDRQSEQDEIEVKLKVKLNSQKTRKLRKDKNDKSPYI
jgi:hypothetical protein